VSDYGYLNARVRAMSTQLLRPPMYEQLLAAAGEEEALDLLHGTAYASDLVQAMTVGHGPAALESALGRNLSASFARLRALAPAEPRRLLAVQLSLWDAANVLAVLRGKATAAEPAEIIEALLPCGEFSEPQLRDLAGRSGVEEVAAVLATWGTPFSLRLRAAIRGAGPRPELGALESAVNEAWFSWALQQVGGGDPAQAEARRMIRVQVDLANVKSALDRVRHRTHGESAGQQAFLAGGLLGAGVMRALERATAMVQAFEALEGSYFAPGVEKGILAFGMTGSLGVMERFLEGVVIAAGCRLFRGDPLGIGVSLGYLWRKYGEFLNLRLLLRGKSHGIPVGTIREELLYA
jgi:vacuolar-type H+-ATPase subunit C/Vma6